MAAFDLILAVVPLKVALGLGRIDFWVFQKNNHEDILDSHLCDYFLKFPKILFSYPKATFNGATTKIGSKAAQNN